MAKQTKKQKFELATLDAKNIVELDGWKAKQESVIKENPFIEIEDRETYEIAKTRRTALVSARTEIQKQDKFIGSVMSKFRKQTIEMAKDLIAITEPHEEKQQSEVSRYEEILEAKRNEKELAEQKRVESIKKEIEKYGVEYSSLVNRMTFETIEKTKEEINKLTALYMVNDFEEYEPLFDEKMISNGERLSEIETSLIQKENQRIEQLKRDQESEMNRRAVIAQTFIDSLTDPKDLISSIEKTFEKEFDFGEFQKEVNKKYTSFLNKAHDKIQELENESKRQKEIKLQEDKNRINNVREGLLDKIFQMDADNHQEELDYIKDALSQDNPFPELEDKFNAMVEIVQKNLDSKMKMINAELEQRKQEAIDAQIAIDARTKQRGKQLEEIGFVFNEQSTENFWNTLVLDLEIWESMVEGLSDEEWTPYFNDINKRIQEANEKNKAFQKRQKSLESDKRLMIAQLNEMEEYFPEFGVSYKNEESQMLMTEIKSSFDLFIKTQVERIQKF